VLVFHRAVSGIALKNQASPSKREKRAFTPALPLYPNPIVLLSFIDGDVGGMARQVLTEVETRFKASIKDVLDGFVGEGLNKETAAKRLGVSKHTLLRWIAVHEVDWPRYTPEHAQNRKTWLRERSLYTVVHNGVEKPLFDAAKEEGIPYNVIIDRYKNGDRDDRLFRPVREYRKLDEKAVRNISREEWDVACELARAIGSKRASEKVGIPMSAITREVKRRDVLQAALQLRRSRV